MNEAEATGSGQEPIYFGSLEAVCFAGLFLSPLLTGTGQGWLWMLLAGFRVVGTLACLGLGAIQAQVRAAGGFFARGILYQLPFWVSALAFPLAPGQTTAALQALVLQLGLTVLVLGLALAPGSLLFPAFYYGSLVWLLGGSTPGPVGWIGLALGLLTLKPLGRGDIRLLEGSRFLQALAIGLAWLTCIGLAPLAKEAERETLLRVLLPWSLLCLSGLAIFDTVRRIARSRWQREGEWSVPALAQATRWLVQRRLVVLAGLFPLLGLMTSDWRHLVVWLLVATAWDRAMSVATSGRTSSEALAWWASWEFGLLWGASRTAGPLVWAWLAVALLSCWLVRRWEPLVMGSPYSCTGGLAQVLRTDLWTPAPDGFSASVKAKIEPSVELDQELRAAAPVGFRQRLLERLQAQPDDEEMEA